MSCHKVAGRGGNKGPDLSTIGAVRDKNWLFQAIVTPGAVGLNESEMPSFKEDLLEAQLEDLARYLAAQKGGEVPAGQQLAEAPAAAAPQEINDSDRAPVMFERYCAGCHMINGEGSASGPDLTEVGTYRDAEFLAQVIANPADVIKGASMPGYAEKLDAETIQDLANFLAVQTGVTEVVAQAVEAVPTATPAPVSYVKDVAPIFEATCVACHGGEKTYAELDMTDYDALMKTGASGPGIIPGDAAKSLLYLTRVDRAEKVDRMPMSGLLSSRDIGTIQDWINQGAQQN